jgi:protein O-GlcNAc transferase
MSSFDEEFKKAYILHQSAKFNLAESIYKELLKRKPNNKDLILLLGTLYLQIKNYRQSELFFLKLLPLDDNNYLVHQNLGVLMNFKYEYKKSIKFLEKSLNLNPNNHHAFFYLSQSYFGLNFSEDALKYLELYIKKTKDNPEAFFNMGNIYFSLNKIEKAIFYYERAIELKPTYHESIANKALALSRLPSYSEAICFYKKAISLNDSLLYRSNLANLLRHIGFYEEAIEQYKKCLLIKPNDEELFISLQNTYHSANQFKDINYDNLKKVIRNLKNGYDPFSLLYLFDDLALQFANSKKYTLKKFSKERSKKEFYNYEKDTKIRIVYVSSDFRKHPIARLIQDVIKKHDRKKFDIYAISLKKSEDDFQMNLSKDFDVFFHAQNCSDEEIINFCKDKRFHIAINLNGYTRFSRSNLFAKRLAPIQISFLGFLGTMGSDFMDYIISDIHITPINLRKFYSEKIIYLPFFQPNNKFIKDQIKITSRAELGLPENKFIFCCFNNSFKINKNIVDAWIKILNHVPNSIFVCYIKNDFQKSNILDYLAKNKIKHNRIIFSEKLPYQLFLGQLSLCDLFLDTYPYNGGATVQDALISGLPVLTLVGKTYSSRMCSSILKSANLSELCAYSFSEYIEKAISLAQDRQKLQNFKKLLSTVYNDSNLNILKFIKFYEAGLEKAFNKYKNNKQIDHIMINGEI